MTTDESRKTTQTTLALLMPREAEDVNPSFCVSSRHSPGTCSPSIVASSESDPTVVPGVAAGASSLSVSSKEKGQNCAESFPFRLHYMLNEVEKDGASHICSWQPHGRCFRVHNPTLFQENIIGSWFRMSKLPSFQRQLNLYGFRRITAGPDKGSYYHASFLRQRPDLVYQIQRFKVKGKGPRKPASPDGEPNFYAMTPMPPNQTTSTISSDIHYQALGATKMTQPFQEEHSMVLKPSEEVAQEFSTDGIVTLLDPPGMSLSPYESTTIGAAGNVKNHSYFAVPLSVCAGAHSQQLGWDAGDGAPGAVTQEQMNFLLEPPSYYGQNGIGSTTNTDLLAMHGYRFH